ncbi:MAG: ABC transporter permease [Terracidiphilus sp.]
MDWLRVARNRIAALFGKAKLDAELDEELRAHVELAVEENLKRGIAADAALTVALREFGGLTQTRERYRTERGLPWLEVLAQDLRFALRMLWKSPGFTAVAVLTLALGIGGNTAIFSIVNGVLLNPLPLPHPAQLVALHESKPNFVGGAISYPNFLDWRKDNHSFSAMAIARHQPFSMTGRGEAEHVRAEFVSAGFFALVGVRPMLGREFTSAEEKPGAAPTAIISEGLWRRKFDSAPNILGQTITLDGKNFSIVGVMPASFRLRFSNFREQDVYAPFVQWDNTFLMNRGAGLGIHGIARLKPGVTIEQARADMDEVTRNLAAAYPDADRGIGAYLVPLKEQIVGQARPFLLVLLGAVGFVLLIACVNVASLLLAKSAGRSREFAVRAALGASRGRVVRQLLTESLALGIAGGALGLIPAFWGTHAALKVLPDALPRANEIGLDFRVLAFTTAISLLTGALFGLAPAMKTSQANPQTALKDGGRGSSGANHRALSTFVVVELAIALVLLTGAGLMIRSLARLWSIDPGFNAHNVLSFGLALPPSINGATAETIRAKMREVDAALASAPGVTAVSPVWGALPMGNEDDLLFWPDYQPRPVNDQQMGGALDYIVEPDYFRLMQIPLERGRFFTAQDNEHMPLVAVVDDVFAHKYFAGRNPIGQRIDIARPDRKLEIVGVVGHVKQWGLDADDTESLRAQLYIPCMQLPDEFIATSPINNDMVLRYDGSLATVLDSIRRANKKMSNEQVIYGGQTMESMISDSMASRRFAMILLGAFAALAMLLACIGIYAVMAYLVAQRTQEVGIRMALGAQRGDVLLLVFRDGAKLAAIGIVAGVAGSIALTRLMGNLLFDVSPTDPAVLAAVCGLLAVVALAACTLPARRAASVDPMRALRTE